MTDIGKEMLRKQDQLAAIWKYKKTTFLNELYAKTRI